MLKNEAALLRRVLILAPSGRDGESAAKVLGDRKLVPAVMTSAAELAASLDEATGVVLMTSEALRDPGMSAVAEVLAAQPAWSDVPIVYLAPRQPGGHARVEMSRHALPPAMTNVMIMERPLSGESLVSAVRWALGIRQRQFQVRDQLADLAEREALLQASREAERRAAQALAWSEARFRGMIDSIEQMVWATLPDGHHDYYNERWYAYTGVPRGSTDGEAWNGVFHPDDQPRAWAIWRHSLDTGEPYHIEYRLRHHTGQYRWVLGRAQAVRDENGRIVRWFGTCTDIQDIVDAREILARSHEDLAREVAARTQERDRIWQVSQDLLGVADTSGVWLSVNPAWQRVLGWSEGQVVGRDSGWLTHPDDAADTRDQFARLASGQPAVTFENRFRREDGAFRILAWRAVALDGKFYCVARDMTDQREQQAALVQAEEQLRQSQKMEAVGQLTGGIAHDFNNMLQVITSALAASRQLLELRQYERIPRMIDIAQRSSFKAAALTHRLLAFSRRQPLDPQPMDVNPLVISMDELIRRTLGENILFDIDLDPGTWQTCCDANQLENALLNMVINARGAMPDGGRLRIATFNAPQDHPLQKRSGKPGDFVVIEVRDNGCGMPPDVLARVFEPFFTTKPLGEGTGLGLSMIYGFAQQSGGTCLIDSVEKQGTTVYMLLPRNTLETAVAPAPSGREMPAAEPGHGQHATVMVVEDDESVRELTVDALKALRFDVVGAPDSARALSILDTGMRFDLLVTDVGLPGLNGRQLAEIALQKLPHLRVLFMTGYADRAALPDGRLAENMRLIVKPFEMPVFLKRVRELLDSRVASTT